MNGHRPNESLPPVVSARPVPAKSSFLLAEQILRDILADNLEPGDALLPEKAMVEKYGIGRGTVREALRLLEYQGAIRIRQGLNGGPYVQKPNSVHLASTIGFRMQLQRTPFRAVVEVRKAMEPMICRLAAERIADPTIDELQRTIDDMRVMVDSHEDSARFNDLNTRFHNVIGWASANPLFHLLADSLLDIMDGAVVGLRYSEESRSGVIAAHEAIVAALRERDADAAAAAMTVHLDKWETYANRMYPEVLSAVVPWSWAGQHSETERR